MSRPGIKSSRAACSGGRRGGPSPSRAPARRSQRGLHERPLALATLLTLAPAAHAYLDPGTGVLIVQAAIGAIAGALVAVKLYWSKIKAGLYRLTGRRIPREPAGSARHDPGDAGRSGNDSE